MFRSLRYRNFRLFFYGQFLSLIGSWLQQTAQSWLVYRLTKDPFLLGLTAFMGQFPVFLLGFYAGYKVDGSNRRRLVMLTQSLCLLQAALLAVLALTGVVQVWHVFALSMLLGLVYSFDIPARQVFIGELVEQTDRHNAIALNSTIVNASRIIGPALGGLLIAAIGEGWCFALNALSYVSILVALCLMKDVRQAPSSMKGSLWEEVGDGLGYAMGHEPIRIVLGALAAYSLAGLPVFVLLPIFAEDVLGSGARGMGILSSFSGFGATIGALVLARRRGTAGVGGVIGRSLLLFCAALAGLAFSKSFALSCALLWLVGFSAIRVLAGSNMALQELASDRFRGRVMSFYSMLFIGVSPLGSFMVGSLAKHLGVEWTVLIEAGVCAAAALWWGPRLRRLLPHAGPPPQLVGPLT